MGGDTELEVRDAGAGDLRGVHAACRFASEAAGTRAESLEVWQWRRSSPWELRAKVAVDAGGIRSHQAGLPVEMACGERRERWVLLVETFVAPTSAGGSGLRHAPARIAAAGALIEELGGRGEGRAPILYGLPTRAVHRMAERFLGFEVVTNAKILRMDPAWVPHDPVEGVVVEEPAEFTADFEELARRAAAEHAAMAVRDRAFLRWRFARPGGGPVVRFLARDAATGTPLGYAVYRRGELDGRVDGLVCDWVVPGNDPRVAGALRARLATRAVRDGMQRLAVLLPETSPEWLEFQQVGFRVRPTGFYLIARTFERRRDVDWMYWNWYFTLADFAG